MESKNYILRNTHVDKYNSNRTESSRDIDSAAEPGSLDVDEEVCTREHFNNLQELHHNRNSNILTPATKQLTKH